MHMTEAIYVENNIFFSLSIAESPIPESHLTSEEMFFS